jgi:glucose-1-phosphate cytidylyltransferase
VVQSIQPQTEAGIWINGGFFIFRKEIFNYIEEGEELVEQPFMRLIAQEQLLTHRHTGFFASIDTLREKVMFDDMFARGDTPWALWDKSPRNARYRANSNGKVQALQG